MAANRDSRLFEYFENDGAYFRKRRHSGLIAVDQVWTGTAWENYKGDRQKPYCFGTQITAADLPDDAPQELNVC